MILFSAYIFINTGVDEYKVIIKEHGYNDIHRLKQAENERIIRVYKTKDNEIVQVVTSKGYKSTIEMIVAIKDDKVKNVDILYHDETPDYGGYIAEKWFLDRLCLPITPKLNVVKVAKVKSNDVVAVTGATISSKAVVEGVNLCIDNYGGIRDE